jgi:uncharacterized protein (DUF488 family)
MPTVCTIGFRTKPLADLITLLRQAGVEAVIDVRLRNTSQLAGYTKRDDLAFLLRKGFGIAYEHHPELAPTDEILADYRRSHDWEDYQARFRSLMVERGAAEAGQDMLSRYRTVCLLCSEPEADHCHRRLVAEVWVEAILGLRVVHL